MRLNIIDGGGFTISAGLLALSEFHVKNW